jgi:hypothetical protein
LPAKTTSVVRKMREPHQQAAVALCARIRRAQLWAVHMTATRKKAGRPVLAEAVWKRIQQTVCKRR